MATISSSIALHDNFTAVLNNALNAVNMTVAAMETLDSSMGTPIDTAAIENARNEIEQATAAVDEMNAAMQGVEAPQIDSPLAPVQLPVEPDVPDPLVDPQAPVQLPVEWQSDNLEVFTSTGVERFQQEIQSANEKLSALNEAQNRIAQTAAQMDLFPADMTADMNSMQSRLQAIQSRIEQIENNPMNIGADEANAGLEQLRAQLDQAIQQQEAMNAAVDSMDVEAANAAYLQLSQTVSGTERYIRDNTTQQGQFNSTIEQGVEQASQLQSMIKSALAAYTGIAGIRKAISWIEDCTEAYNTQLNAENQLVTVLGNMLDEDYVSQFEVEVTADTTSAVDAINAVSGSVDDEVVVTMSAEAQALETEFDAITEKASEIQANGIYGDESMIAAAAEFATYFSDVDAITTMMDTLSDYAMGMSGGGEIDTQTMVDYATSLGKIMSGSYDAMTKKGFEFSEAQEAIIEGTATEQQIIDTLGEEYLDMSADMQAAAAISQVIEESWSGLYEAMSNTPEGKIIQMNNAFGDLQETIGEQLYPYVILFVDAINDNWPTIESVISGITTALQFCMGVLSTLMNAAFSFAQVVQDNWSLIAPVVYGIAAALLIYNAYLAISNGIEAASAAAKTAVAAASYIHAAATHSETAATKAATAAQMGLNTAMLASPVTWVIAGIIAVIALVYLAVAAYNKFTDSTASATGIIMGIFSLLWAFIYNGFIVPLYNGLATLVNFFGNAFNNPAATVEVLFYNMCLTIIGYIQDLASAIETLINKIPGVTVDITSGLDNFYSKLEEAQQAVNDESGWVEYVGKLDFKDYSDAWDEGYSFGEGIEDKISNLSLSDLFNIGDMTSIEDYLAGYSGNISDIAESASTVADSVDCTEEQLRYLRDIAEQETVNRYTLADVTVNQTNNNNISSDTDLDGVITGLTEASREALAVVAEGVHY